MDCKFVFFQAEDGIRALVLSRGLGDVYKRQVVARVPGIEADQLDIQLTGENLTIRGRFDSDAEREESKDWCWYASELWFGSFERTITLPTRVQGDKVSAEFKNGVLNLTVPKAEEVKPRSIKVKVAK